MTLVSRLPLLLLAPMLASAQPPPPADERPAFDKSGHLGTVWAHVNAWKDIPFAQDSMDVDYALQRSQGNPVQDFALMARQLERHGMDGVYVQGSPGALRNYLEGFRKAGNWRKATAFIANARFRKEARAIKGIDDPEAKAEAVAEVWAGWLNRNRDIFVEHPNYHRVDGHPVIVLYGGGGLDMTPELWARAMPKIEQQAYRCIWLKHDHFWREGTLETWMPHVDGVTQYASGHHYRYVGRIAEAMKRDWPGKIFEANAGPKHQSVLQGQTGHDRGRLTAKWREALRFAFDLGPDSMHLTNWNDIEENSHIFPSYLQRDSYLRIFDALSRDWRGEPPLRTERPKGIFSGKIDVLVGHKLDFEWVLFGLAEGVSREVEARLRLTDAGGDVVHTFEPRTVAADELTVLRFQTSSMDFADRHGVFPELTLVWNGETLGPWRLPGTRLWYGQTPTDLPRMTPLEDWRSDLAVDWTLRGAGQAEPQAARPRDVARADPELPFTVKRGISAAEKGGPTEAWLMRNGEPETRLVPRQSYFRSDATTAPYRHCDRAPFSWLNLEIEAFDFTTIPFGEGTWTSRQPSGIWASRPIYLAAGGKWREPVSVPVPVQALGSAREARASLGSNHLRNIPFVGKRTVEVPRYRVPFWQYPIENNWGGLFRDRSGYQHHGWLGTHAGNRHTVDGPYGFRFSHLYGKAVSPVEARGALNAEAPDFRRDADGEGYLRFDGKDDYVFLPPRSRMPFAATYAMRVRAAGNGKVQTLLGTMPAPFFDGLGRLQVFVLQIDGAGRPELVVYPGSRLEQRIRADSPLTKDGWTDIAVTYDLERWRLWVDGKPAGEGLAVEPRGEWHVGTQLYVGCDADPAHGIKPGSSASRRDFFGGDLADLRIVGRPLGGAEITEAAER